MDSPFEGGSERRLRGMSLRRTSRSPSKGQPGGLVGSCPSKELFMPHCGATIHENESPPPEGCRGGLFRREDP